MYDLILRGGTVVDGTRSRPYAADVCIRDGRIARIAPDAGEEAREVVDVSGLTVAPGFIDIHSHSDACPLLSFQPESKLFQGITTEIIAAQRSSMHRQNNLRCRYYTLWDNRYRHLGKT